VSLAFHRGFTNATGSEFQPLMDVFSGIFRLPRDLPVVFAETGQVNAWYDPSKHQIVMTYDLVEFFAKDAARNCQSKEQAAQRVWGSIIFTLMHELAHALIGEMDIPVVGREEDAADEFATLLLLEAGETGHQALFGTADWFEAMSRSQKDLNFWDEHSLDQQRLFNILLLMYGHDPKKYGPYVTQYVPQQRLSRALRDYKIKDHRWEKLLEPYVRSKL